MERLTAEQIIDETVTYYAADPNGRRGRDSAGVCEYRTVDGKVCAYGRVIKEDIDLNSLGGTVEDVQLSLGYPCHNNAIVEEPLKEQYRGHTIQFWMDIQSIHDINSNWDDNGLTQEGKYRVELLKGRYSPKKEVVYE